MSLCQGTYTIYDTDSGRVLAYYAGPNRIGTWDHNHTDNQKWYIKRYPGSSGYAIQNIMNRYKKYLPARMNGPYTIGVDEGDAGIFELEHQFQDFYLIKLIGKTTYLDHPYLELDDKYTPASFSNKGTLKGCFWRFEKISDDSGGTLKRRANNFACSSAPQTRAIFSQSLGSLYVDDAHLHTDMLFNMPRTPFTRDQRIAALEWARMLGASNVPSIHSFDECERRLGVLSTNTNNLGQIE
ncbi:hypothetical protein RSOLAG1IB_04954 [Rhizoctonia solani AG-1 IB]|uniref:Ricin B lectin domain-containing protein n=1 Tax=Thanatephorus cucumeris (strain AG1-IB / isolate 7/3/14) TaxID=1108050 RepID=A0A0B7G296_THACB|nr:hypothetical protein RSOLAG1IB_04954 [Rhizoctonia solani AG-1 IB]